MAMRSQPSIYALKVGSELLSCHVLWESAILDILELLELRAKL
jgi:hypothetical protein